MTTTAAMRAGQKTQGETSGSRSKSRAARGLSRTGSGRLPRSIVMADDGSGITPARLLPSSVHAIASLGAAASPHELISRVETYCCLPVSETSIAFHS
jgi:hypothetical protein